MSKGNSELLSKHQSKIEYSTSGIIGSEQGYEVLKEVVLRIRNKNAIQPHSVELLGRMATDNVWESIGTVLGSDSDIFNIATWDYVQFKCQGFHSNDTTVTLLTSAYFTDGSFVEKAISDMKNDLDNRLVEIESTLCDIKAELKINNEQLQYITDLETEDLK